MRYILILLLWIQLVYPQVPDIAKDTINLSEVVVQRNDRNLKIKQVQLKGPCSYPENMKDASEIITLVDNLPGGTLKSLTFYFNTLDPATYKEQVKNFKNADFEVVLYDVGDDNIPANAATYEHQIMAVDKSRTGRIKVDLLGFNIATNKKMYIGLRKVTSGTDAKEFFVDCLCSGQDRYMTFTREAINSPWERRWVCAALRLEAEVVQKK